MNALASARTANVRAYWHIFFTALREDSANAKRFLAGMAASVVRIVFIAAIYKVAYALGSKSSGGLSYANAMWSVSVYFAFLLNLGIRNVFKIVDREVRTGVVEVNIIKPISYRLSKVCELLGKNAVEFLGQLVVLPLLLFVLVGAPDMSFMTPLGVLAFMLLTVLAMVSAASLFLTVGLTAFWLDDATPTYRIIDKLSLIFGGGFVPIALLPHVAQAFVRYSPFGVYAAPTQFFNQNIMPVLGATIVAAVAWSAALLVMCNYVWHRALVRIEVNGG